MKIIEKIGWLLFLVSLMTFIVTVVYWVIKSVAGQIWELVVMYNEHLDYATMGSVVALCVGLALIRLGAADKESDL
jgi:hypothetical protein